jgi:hypothetical protein
MTRSISLHLDAFGQEGVEGYALTTKTSPSSVVRTAAHYYLSDREASNVGWRVPRFARESGRRPEGFELRIELDDDTWAALEEEAARQAVPTELVAQHAVLYFLADAHTGRLARRLGEALERGD